MKYIRQTVLENMLGEAGKGSPEQIDPILAKARALKRLTLWETASLVAAEDRQSVDKVLAAAAEVKNAIYGNRVVLFAPLYISNLCKNNCLYCGFKRDNRSIVRKSLTTDEVRQEAVNLLAKGHKRVLMVSGEATVSGQEPVTQYTDAIRAIYSAEVGPHRIKRVNVNCAPLSVEDFKKLKEAGIGTYQLFQETYHDQTYRRVHPAGPKSDPDDRIDAVDRAFLAGIDDVGVGVLYGLYDWRYELLALLAHVEHLEERFGVGPHTISVPRIEPAEGVRLTDQALFPVNDEDFKRIIAILRLSVPYTGIILSTRETAELRDELFSLGVSQASAESHTSPGGYSEGPSAASGQFAVSDQRCLNEVMGALMGKGIMPSFCAACYRKERTGKVFMDLAKPGTIKGKCAMNAMITLKEYLDDFASVEVRKQGYAMIARMRDGLDGESQTQLERFFEEINKGTRDVYV